nr:hypothetical protein [Rhodobacter sp. CZR27]
MRRQATAKHGHDLGGIIAFSHREEEWAARLAAVVDEHFLPTLEEFDLDFDDLTDILGEQLPWTLWGCAFEDFLARRWEPDGGTIVDVYLKRRGWSEKVLNRAYIEGLRDAHVSLHEVSDVVPGPSMALRDLLTGGDPVTVREKSATRSLKQWDRIVARVVPVRDHHLISGGVLPFSKEAVEMLFDGLRGALRLRKTAEPRLTMDQLRHCAPIFGGAWFFTRLPRLLNPQMPIKALADPRVRGEFLDWRDRLGLKSKRSADYAFSVLALILAWAYDRWKIPSNPCEKPGRLYAGSRADDIWTEAQIDTFMKKAPKPVRLPFLLAISPAVPAGDLDRAAPGRHPEADLERLCGQVIRLKQSKTGRHMVIPVARQLREALEAAKGRRKTLTICETSRGQPWTSDGFKTSFGKAQAAAGIEA